eukprot:489085-Amphidinium_carterae.1
MQFLPFSPEVQPCEEATPDSPVKPQEDQLSYKSWISWTIEVSCGTVWGQGESQKTGGRPKVMSGRKQVLKGLLCHSTIPFQERLLCTT